MDEWKEIHPRLYVSRDGWVKQRDRLDGKIKEKFLHTDPQRYVTVTVKGATVGVHRLIAEAFIGPPPTTQHEVNHKNGVRCDNRVENLEWVTRRENARHAIEVLGRESRKGIPWSQKARATWEKQTEIRKKERQMARLNTISGAGPGHTKLSHRAAADLARKLREIGYPVSKATLYQSTPHRIAHLLSPKNDPSAAGRLELKICQMAGFVPEAQP